MRELLWLVPALPLAGFVLLLVGRRFPHGLVAFIGVGTVCASMVLSVWMALAFAAAGPPGNAWSLVSWDWVSVGGFTAPIAFYLDALSVTMMSVVTVVGFLILLYSARFMWEEEGYGRFFAYMDLFVASMLILVLGRNLLLLFLGWEGVGLSSYLLIGFWYRDAANGRAAIKAFVVTRVGDAALAVGLFLLWASLGTLEIQELMHRAVTLWPVGSALPVAAALLLLGGAVGKSAQLPLATWLPDAMAGPTPVSALIHAATMVTAGVYLIARTNVIFALAPPVQFLVAVIGVTTLLVSGFSAATQKDIKRVLAYSTIGQVGYMFLALGVGAWSAAIFHFMSHACFKSLLFLGAGVIILNLHREHDMFKMGGLGRRLPLAFGAFLVGAWALVGLPPTAGFSSKELILYSTWTSGPGGTLLWLGGLVGVFLTGVYTFRLVFLTFFGPSRQEPERKSGPLMAIPLVVLAGFTLVVAALGWPRSLGGQPFLVRFLQTALPPASGLGRDSAGLELTLQILSVSAGLLGILFAYVLVRRELGQKLYASTAGRLIHRYWYSGWGFDWVYDKIFVRPIVWAARANRDDFIDIFYRMVAWVSRFFHVVLSLTQTGHLRWYAAGVAFGAIVVLTIVVFL